MPNNTHRFAALVVGAALVLTACSSLPARDDENSDDDPIATLQVSGSAARYLAIAEPANISLDQAFDGLEDLEDDAADPSTLPAERADFRLAATTERSFDRDLLAIALPPAAEATARALVKVNEARADITEQAAAARSADQVEDFEQDITVANEVVEQQVEILRDELGLPPPDSS
jgi:hypothetical protein